MKINFFGCSFTEGGGLNNFEYYNFLNNTNYNINDNIKEQYEEITLFKEENRYSNIVGKILEVETKNYAEGCNSNEGILKKLIEISDSETTNVGDVFVVQTSFFSRKFYWYEPFNDFISVNALSPEDWPFRNKEEWMPLHQLHNLNVTYCHNEEYEIQKLLKNMEIYNSYFKEKKLKLFWIPWNDMTTEQKTEELNEYNRKTLEKIPNIIYFDDMSMGRYCNKNALLLKHHFKKSNDSHKSVIGHKIIAEKISEYLKNKL